MATYDFKCDKCGVVEERIFPMAQDEKVAVCKACQTPMRQLITGGQRTIFKGDGWTPKFTKYSPPPYDPEKDCESVDRQRAEAGLEPNPWKPTKAVHPIRSSGIDIKSKK